MTLNESITDKQVEQVKGKNFSANNTGKRRKSDFYETPYSITKQLLEVERFEGSTLEPACGNGAISNLLKCTAYDKETDFLKETRQFDNVLTNPPYSLAFEFVLKAKEVAKKKIAFLLPLSYLHGKKRFDYIYQDKKFPLARVYVFTRYPMLGDELRSDGKYRTGMMVYAWFIWDKDYTGEPIIRWLDNNKFVLTKRNL